MTLHPIPLNFLIYEENFLFFFISVHYTVHAGGEEAILQNAVKRGDV
jgi:hypothetical protein